MTPAMGSSQANESTRVWESIIQARRTDLEHATPFHFNFTNAATTREGFQEFIHDIVKTHAQKPLSRGLQKISATLGYVKSFSGALSSFSQVDMAGMIVWGTLQILIEVIDAMRLSHPPMRHSDTNSACAGLQMTSIPCLS